MDGYGFWLVLMVALVQFCVTRLGIWAYILESCSKQSFFWGEGEGGGGGGGAGRGGGCWFTVTTKSGKMFWKSQKTTSKKNSFRPFGGGREGRGGEGEEGDGGCFEKISPRCKISTHTYSLGPKHGTFTLVAEAFPKVYLIREFWNLDIETLIKSKDGFCVDSVWNECNRNFGVLILS